jgi:zinc protease
MNTRKYFIICLLTFFSTFSYSQSIDVNIEAKKYTLENGLRVIIVENHKLPIYSMYLFYDVGSKHETAGITGASHFLEHLMFKGAKKFKEGEFDHFIESHGGNTNAFTTYDRTVYHQSLPINTLDKMIEMEADRMENLLLAPESFEKERQVILEERKVRYENSPMGQLFYEVYQKMFQGTPYEGSVIGSISDLKRVTRQEILDYFKMFYAPNNAILLIAGDVEFSKTQKLINKYFEQIPKSKKLEDFKVGYSKNSNFAFSSKIKSRYDIKGEVIDPVFVLAYPAEKLGEKKAFVKDLLANILAEGESSFLNQQFVSIAKPILTSLTASNYNLVETGLFSIRGALVKGQKLNQVIQLVQKKLKESCETAINEKAFLKTKNQFLIGAYSELETNDGTALFLGLRESIFNDFNFYHKEFEIYSKISLEEIKNECRDLFAKKPVVFTIWNKN